MVLKVRPDYLWASVFPPAKWQVLLPGRQAEFTEVPGLFHRHLPGAGVSSGLQASDTFMLMEGSAA